MLKSRKKELIPERKRPGDREPEVCSPGSIEQQLDMCEEGSLRGDEVSRRTAHLPTPNEPASEDPADVLDEFNSFQVTMSERDREGDELTGDEHSSGLQGEESELSNQPSIDSGIPGAMSREQAESEGRIHRVYPIKRKSS